MAFDSHYSPSQLDRPQVFGKVIGFDNWTGGAHLFERLVKAFNDRGLELTLLHLGSWGNDPGRPREEVLGNLQIRDVSFYGKMGLAEILEAEKPAAVLFMSVDTFAHRAFNRHCRDRNVPTIHLYHGLVRVQAVDGGLPYKTNVMSQIRFARSKLVKALKHVWPAYAHALWVTGARASEWFRFLRDIVRLAVGKYTRVSAEDARTDRCCVYAGADIEHALHKYKFPAEHVIAVGNPDLMQFGLKAHMIGSRLERPPCERSDVMYVDTGLVYSGCVFTTAQFVEHIVTTKDALALQGKRLIFKPHPDHLRVGLVSKFTELGVEVCSNADFLSRLQNCCACIVEPSTVSIIPALLGMPLFLATYGKLKDQLFGEVLTTYPRARKLTDLGSFDALLAAEGAAVDKDAARNWIAENSGPLPAEEMPHRVAELAASLIVARRPVTTRILGSR